MSSRLYYQYQTEQKIIRRKEQKKRGKICKIPNNIQDLNDLSRTYLLNRKFNPDKLVNKYNIKSFNNIGDYKFRLFIPIYFDYKIVSFQTRDVTENQIPKYKACSKENEQIHHKDILYNLDNCNQDKVIVVEGVTDVWRMGNDCAATFGVGFTNRQIQLLSQRFKQVFILYDSEEIAQKQANKVGNLLNGLGIDTELILMDEGDPGDLMKEEARCLKKQLLGGNL